MVLTVNVITIYGVITDGEIDMDQPGPTVCLGPVFSSITDNANLTLQQQTLYKQFDDTAYKYHQMWNIVIVLAAFKYRLHFLVSQKETFFVTNFLLVYFLSLLYSL